MTNFNLRNLIFTALFAVGFYAPVTSAMVYEESDNTIRVTFGELDVSQQEGVEVLYQRIRTAARKVCGANDYRIRSLGIQRTAKKCFNNAVDNTVDKIGNSALETLHNG